VPAGESLQLVVQADSQTLVPGDVRHDWVLMVESNGGHAILGVRIKVLSPHLKLDPALIDLGALDLIQPGAGKKAELMVRNGGPGVLTGAVMTNPDWLTIEPVAFCCRSGESQLLHPATTNLKTGEYNQPIQLVSNAGISVPVYLRVRLSLEPEMVHIPAGGFLRGSKEDDKAAAPSEKPQRSIYLSEYWMGKYPVTNAQYAAFVEATGRHAPDHWKGGHPPEKRTIRW
jgi:formylglycine-generating enzyme required for sulfatase activity